MKIWAKPYIIIHMIFSKFFHRVSETQGNSWWMDTLKWSWKRYLWKKKLRHPKILLSKEYVHNIMSIGAVYKYDDGMYVIFAIFFLQDSKSRFDIAILVMLLQIWPIYNYSIYRSIIFQMECGEEIWETIQREAGARNTVFMTRQVTQLVLIKIVTLLSFPRSISLRRFIR